MNRHRSWILVSLCILSLLGLAAQPTQAGFNYSFSNITNNSNVNVASQLSVVVSDPGLNSATGKNRVTFTFYNTGSIGSIISEIYFDDGTLLGISNIADSDGVGTAVRFIGGSASPGNLPGGENLNPDFVTTAGFLADSSPASRGVNNGSGSGQEWVAITFDLLPGKSYQDTIAALDGGVDLRIGLHVKSIDGVTMGSDSDSFVNITPNVVPVPPALVMLASAVPVLLVGGYLRRRKKLVA